MKNILSLCEKTVQHFSKLRKETNTNNFLLSVKGGGCNGLKYSIVPFFEKKDKYDEIVNYENFNIIICGKSIMYLIGLKISWNEDLFGSGLRFENPNANSKCGCGETFSI